MSSQIVASSSNMTIYGENAGPTSSESDESDWNCEENCSDGEFDNNETRDDMDFETHVDPLLETGGVRDILYNSFEPNLSDDASVVDSDSDGEIASNLWTSFRPSRDMNDPHFTLGMTFASKQEFKDALQNYAIKNGKDLKVVKNDKERFIVECKTDGCPFRISLRKVINSLSWRILKMKENHEGCSWAFDNGMLNSSKIAKRWCNEIKFHPNWKMRKFKDKVHNDDKFNMSERQTYRVLAKAKTMIQGNEEDNFNKIWNYVLEINRTNPMSTCSVKLSELQELNGDKRFLRFYMCWDACKKGFKYCRPIIGVDGTHLKNLTGGVLLTAIGIDSNDSIFPLCYAIVEKETKQSWTWFLHLLRRDLEISDDFEHEFTLISDKQKGIIAAHQDVLPRMEHRFCVRHLHENMKVAGFQGKSIKDALWRCARACTVPEFTVAFRALKELDVNAFEWLVDKHPREWSRSHFSCHSHSDMLVNNICECFNSAISEARQQPIIGCLESMRQMLMIRMYNCRETAKAWINSICPRILDKLAVIEKQAASCIATQCDYHLFEVRGMYGGQQEVNLEMKSCSCRKWDLTGIPCKHAVCAIWLIKGSVHGFVDKCYSRKNYMQIYGQSIHPMAGPEQWPISYRKPPLPPLYTSRPGRPRKSRKKSAGELPSSKISKDGVSVARKHIQLHCTICRKAGHNCRSCPYKVNMKSKQMKPRKRTLKASEPIQIFIEEQQDTLTSEQQGITTEQQQDIPTTEERESIPVNEEQNIMTQEDIDFMNMFDFSTPFEENPTPFQQQPIIVEEYLGSAFTIQQNEHGVRMCYGLPPPLKKPT